eukprot:TRINITY_DN174_c0_g1_i2.p1 TRINITY_DN174_c0_g1~~TRINITY_DN174_c0_g1_i2.p1  ORF type:complete len:486 (+),score=35.87 TRINITY_DN174_c0_g1_i2:94-1458(+)
MNLVKPLIWACLSLFLTLAYGTDSLRSAVIFFRHGARAPMEPLPAFEPRITWPTGYGELTPSGHRQLHLFGRMLRKRYIEDLKFIPNNYSEASLHIQSTDYHRTVMSTRSVLLGLYPGGLPHLSNEQLSKESIWIPPVNLTISEQVKKGLNYSGLPFDIPTIPVKNMIWVQDRLLKMTSCELYNKYRKEYYLSAKFDETYKEHNQTFQEVCKLVGIDCSKENHYRVLLHTDYILGAEFDGQLPELSERPDLLSWVEKFNTRMLIEEVTYKPIMASIVMHSFSEVVPDFLKKAMIDPAAPKMALFGTHDDTVLAYLSAMGINKELYERIQYASHIMIELWKSEDADDKDETKHYVNMIYNGVTVMDKVPLLEFIDQIKTKGRLNDTWESVCGASPDANTELFKRKDQGGLIIGLLVVVAVLILMLLGIVIKKLVCRKTSARANVYLQDPEISINH